MNVALVMVPAGIALLILATAGENGRILGIDLGRQFSREERIAFAVLGLALLIPGAFVGLGIWSFN